ncbi:MAG: hypothetical protein KKH94_07830 [Candidatus Omnitrophica bacterium]|nr:hypothetical protein [Candidatus Omnitrophota bacterium]
MKRVWMLCCIPIIIMVLSGGSALREPANFTDYFTIEPKRERNYSNMSEQLGFYASQSKITFIEGKTFGYRFICGVDTLLVDTDGIKMVKREEMEKGAAELTFEPPILLLPSELVKNKHVELSGTITAKSHKGEISKGTYSGYVKVLNTDATVIIDGQPRENCLQIERRHYCELPDGYVWDDRVTEEYLVGIGLVKETAKVIRVTQEGEEQIEDVVRTLVGWFD